ncbi:MAG TPA: hypothetical protein VMB49_18110 [Acidobacteriaceae bacterium]|nr:hypothetical protein [Acidobacteriaceae bacterium]
MRTFTKVSARLFAAVLAAASLAPVAQAQNRSFVARITVPFAFEVSSGRQLNPGVYDISVSGGQTMVIRGTNSAALAMIWQQANVGLPISHGKAVFTHYGDKYYLRSISVTGSSTRLLFAQSKHERESAVASGKSTSSVDVALLQTGR